MTRDANHGSIKILFILLIGMGALFILVTMAKDLVNSAIKDEGVYQIIEPVASGYKNLLPSLLPSQEVKELRGEEKERVNILLLGIGGEGHIGELLTDTIMLVSFSLEGQKVDVFSVPRDLAVRIPGKEAFTKINSLYVISGEANFPSPGGIEMLQGAIEKVNRS